MWVVHPLRSEKDFLYSKEIRKVIERLATRVSTKVGSGAGSRGFQTR
jgi:hypothetical protein